MKRLALVALALVLAAAAVPPAGAQTKPPLKTVSIVIPSKTASDWPTYVAEKYGFFAANGLEVQSIVTGSSANDAQQLAGGSVDIAEVSTTQLVLAILGGAPMVAVVSRATAVPYFVLAKKGITSTAQLKGKLISIGGPSDITRVFMDAVLEHANLKPDDYTYTYAGSTSDRFAALVAGAIDATLLFPPFSAKAMDLGFSLIDLVPNYFPVFPFDTWSVRPQWAKDHPDLVTAFVRAHLQAVKWLYDPANKAKAIALLSEETNTTPADATVAYDVFIAKFHYFSTTGLYTPAMWTPVLAAMVKTQMLKAPMTDPARLYDNTFAQKAALTLPK